MPLPAWFSSSFAFAFGAVWGSFLNVVIVRLPRDESVVFPASHCLACGAAIRAWDNIPILSYLILRGRCRACGARFSPRYALVELLSGLGALACVQVFGVSWAALGFYVFLALLGAIAFIDLEHWIIPHELSWPGIAVGLAFSLVNPRARPLEALLGAALGWAGFTLLSWLGEKVFRKEALGLGDRWLLAMESAFLGYQAILPLVLLSSLQGTVAGLTLIALGKSQTGERPAPAPAPAPDDGGAQAPSVPPSGLEAAPPAQAPDPEVAAGSPGEDQGARGRPPNEPSRGQAPRSSAGQSPSSAQAPDLDDEDWVPPKHALPFGPFLALAGIEQLFFGPQLAHWYQGLITRYLVR